MEVKEKIQQLANESVRDAAASSVGSLDKWEFLHLFRGVLKPRLTEFLESLKLREEIVDFWISENMLCLTVDVSHYPMASGLRRYHIFDNEELYKDILKPQIVINIPEFITELSLDGEIKEGDEQYGS